MIPATAVRDLAIYVRGSLPYRFLSWREDQIPKSPEGTKMVTEMAAAFLVLDDEDGARLFAWRQVWGDS